MVTTLYYYQALGRANQIRLCLAAAGMEWEEEYPSGFPPTAQDIATWKTLGGNLVTNVPMLVLDDDVDGNESQFYCQSSAILRLVGRKGHLMPNHHGQNGKQDEYALYLMDKIIADAEDLRAASYQAMRIFGGDEAGIVKFVQHVLPLHLQNFEKNLANKDFFTGPKLTIADFTAYDAICSFGETRVPGCLSSHPKLQEWKKRVESNVGIAAYLASPRYEKLYKWQQIQLDADPIVSD